MKIYDILVDWDKNLKTLSKENSIVVLKLSKTQHITHMNFVSIKDLAKDGKKD